MIMSRNTDLLEVNLNMFGGMVINAGLTMLIFDTSITQAMGATAVFFISSYLRTYLLRIYFRRREERLQ